MTFNPGNGGFSNVIMTTVSKVNMPGETEVFDKLRELVFREIKKLPSDEQINIRNGGESAKRAKKLIVSVLESEKLKFDSSPNMGRFPTQPIPELCEKIFSLMYSLGPLDAILATDIEDIAINGAHEIMVRDSSGWSPMPKELIEQVGDGNAILSMLNLAISNSGQQASNIQPIVDDKLPNGHRISIVTEPVAADGIIPLAVIRKHKEVNFTMEDFVCRPVKVHPPKKYKLIDLSDRWHPDALLSPAASAFLQACMYASLNVILIGATGVGKTSFLSNIGGFIPYDRRMLVLEDTRELKFRPGDTPQNCIYMTTVLKRLEGGTQVTMDTLVKTALRQRPDHLILGESRGAEMWDLLNAMQTGHAGNLTSVHAISSGNLIDRVKYMVSLPPASIHLSTVEASKLIGSSFNVAITLLMSNDGRRHVKEITAFTGDLTSENLPELEYLFLGGGPENGYRLQIQKETTSLEPMFKKVGLSFSDIVAIADKESQLLEAFREKQKIAE